MAFVDDSVFIPFRDFVNLELPRRAVMITITRANSYDGNPNLSVEPILTGAPAGTWYLRDEDSGGNQDLWQKMEQTDATSWVLRGGPSFTPAASRTYNEIPTGVINGINTTFTTVADYTSGTETLYFNGLRQTEGVSADYTRVESGGVGTGFDTIEFAVAPRTGDCLLIDYNPA